MSEQWCEECGHAKTHHGDGMEPACAWETCACTGFMTTHPSKKPSGAREESEALETLPHKVKFLKPMTDKEAAAKLREIFDDLQTRFHDQWDWMDAEFSLQVLEAHLAPGPSLLPEEAKPAEDGWISVEDRLPEPDQRGVERKWYLVSDGERMDFALFLKSSFFGRSLQFRDVKWWREPPAKPPLAARSEQVGTR